MLDYFYSELLKWWISLLDGELATAIIYGVIAAAFVTGGYAWLVAQRKHNRADR